MGKLKNMTIKDFAKKHYPDTNLDTIRYHFKTKEDILVEKKAISVETPFKSKKVLILDDTLTKKIIMGESYE